jgi:hypothetical protein
MNNLFIFYKAESLGFGILISIYSKRMDWIDKATVIEILIPGFGIRTIEEKLTNTWIGFLVGFGIRRRIGKQANGLDRERKATRIEIMPMDRIEKATPIYLLLPG